MQKAPFILAVVLTVALSLTATGISVYQFRSLQQAREVYLGIHREEDTYIDRTIVEALRQIVQTRADIHENMPEKALHDVGEAARVAADIYDDFSSTVIRKRIWIARKHLEFEPPEQVLGDMSAIYAALGEAGGYLPRGIAKRHLDEAMAYLEKKDKSGAGRELALADRSLAAVEVELPLHIAEKYIDEARLYLIAGNATKADDTLKRAEHKTEAISVIVRSPLRHAKESFWLAIKRYTAGQMSEAGMYVNLAKGYLEQAVRSGDTKGREDAKKLAGDVTELEKKINRRGKAGGTVLVSVWERSKALAEREADYLATGWAEEKTVRPHENVLIEAKLHMACAESYQVTAGEPARAVEELNKAEMYLEKALKSESLGDTAREKIIAIEKIMDQLKRRPEDKGAAIGLSYSSIAAELSEMIHCMKWDDMIKKLEGSE